MACVEYTAGLLTGLSHWFAKESAQTILRGTEEKCGSSRVRTVSGSRPPLLFRLSENSGDESMSDVAFDSLPCSPSSATPHSHKVDVLSEWASYITFGGGSLNIGVVLLTSFLSTTALI